MAKYITLAVTFLVILHLAICRSWHGFPNHHMHHHHSPSCFGHERSFDFNNNWNSYAEYDSHLKSGGLEYADNNERPVRHDLFACLASCPIALVYDPVCGTDNVTYKNIDHLRCAWQCGVAVALSKRTQCDDIYQVPETYASTETPDTEPDCVWGVPAGIPSSTEIPTAKASSLDLNMCISTCVTSALKSPVCGTDGFTYNNEEHLHCAQLCGIEVTVSRLAACPSGNNDGNGSPGWTTTSNPIITTSAPDAVANNCMQTCFLTPEYNPICGSNGITYNNEGHLYCAQRCGVDVSLKRRSPCSDLPKQPNIGDANSATTQTSVGGETTIAPAILDCIRSCPVTAEYSPVCGTNNITYRNQGRLECARDCGVAVSIGRFSACSALPPSSTVQTANGTNNNLLPLPIPLDIDSIKDVTPTQQNTISSSMPGGVFTDAPTTEETTEVSVDPRFNSQGQTFST